MKLIADSGSTKCDWVILNDDWDVVDRVKTMGLNPYFHNEILVYNVLIRNDQFSILSKSIEEVYFYGAGCSNTYYNTIMFKGLSRVFPNAKIIIDHDLKACAFATYMDEPGISCIIGTGSNSCYYDGVNMDFGNPSLGFIVGDEGSGSYFGKMLLRAYFYNQLPTEIAIEFQETFNLSHLDFSKSVYENDQANVFLASFMRFITARKDSPFFQKMIEEGFELFFRNHVMCFKEYPVVKTNFVGSISYYLQDEIKKVADGLGIKTGLFIQKPIDSLITYHKINKLTVS